MAKRHMKSGSTSLLLRERQVNIAMRYRATRVRMVLVKPATKHNRSQVSLGMQNTETLVPCQWECKLAQP